MSFMYVKRETVWYARRSLKVSNGIREPGDVGMFTCPVVIVDDIRVPVSADPLVKTLYFPTKAEAVKQLVVWATEDIRDAEAAFKNALGNYDKLVNTYEETL